jgi:phenylacetate-CoA ligase
MPRLTEYLRKEAFWLSDALKGGSVKKHFSEIKRSMGLQDKTAASAIAEGKLESIIAHATSTVSYYKDFAGQNLTNLPVTNKNLIRLNEEVFLSASYSESTRIASVTSGSTGTPFKVYHDHEKKMRNSADTIYFAGLAGFTIGERLYYLKIWSENNKKSPVQQWMQNIIPIDVIQLDDNKIAHLFEVLKNESSTVGMLGYSSALELVARFAERNNISIVNSNVKNIISMSESLNEYTKETLSRVFGVQAVSRYSNIENGIIAQQETNGKMRFLINTASYHVEILDLNSDVAVKDGELGRIVVTDLYNKAMPMLRYDTGDIGALDPTDNRYLLKIEGRKLDQIFGTNGELVSSYIVYKNMWQYTEIVQYQFVQDGPSSYLFKINAEGPFTREEKLVNEFKQYLGNDADFRIEYVSEIPLLSSGKRKKIMNTYHNQI